MSENFERHKELSKKVLIPGEAKSSVQKTPGQVQLASKQLMYLFSLCAIVGFFIFVAIWIIAGFSKWAVMLPFACGICSIVIALIRQQNKT